MLSLLVLTLVVAHVAAAPSLSSANHTQQPPTREQQTTSDKPWPPAGVFKSGGAVTAPRLIRDVKPKYTPAAMRAKIEGIVVMEAVVGRTGAVGEVRVKRSLEGLDDEAVKALRNWRFEPGRKDGVAVPVLIEVEMTFTLRR
jgi:TonB family protein